MNTFPNDYDGPMMQTGLFVLFFFFFFFFFFFLLRLHFLEATVLRQSKNETQDVRPLFRETLTLFNIPL